MKNESMTLQEAADYALKKAKMAPISRDVFGGRVRRIVAGLGGERKISEITVEVIEEFFIHEVKTGVSPRTVENYRHAMRQIFKVCGLAPRKTLTVRKLIPQQDSASAEADEGPVALKFKTTSLQKAIRIMGGEPRGRFGVIRARVLKKIKILKAEEIFLFKAGNDGLPIHEVKAIYQALWGALKGKPFGVVYSKRTHWFGVGREQDMATVKQAIKGAE